jgi:hypothetical protein
MVGLGAKKHFWYYSLACGIFYGYLVYFMTMCNILWAFGLFYGGLAYFRGIWFIFPRVGKNLANLFICNCSCSRTMQCMYIMPVMQLGNHN